MKQLAKWFLAAMLAVVYAMPTFAHGVRITHTIDEVTGEITVVAEFDTGTPLAEGQISIFAPSDPITPWQTNTVDEQGRYTFLPDYSDEGFWEIQVRQAGHGGLISVELDSSMAPSDAAATTNSIAVGELDGGAVYTITGDAQLRVQGDVVITATGNVTGSNPQSGSVASGFTPAQIVIMSASVIWGFIGTALYFVQRRKS